MLFPLVTALKFTKQSFTWPPVIGMVCHSMHSGLYLRNTAFRLHKTRRHRLKPTRWSTDSNHCTAGEIIYSHSNISSLIRALCLRPLFILFFSKSPTHFSPQLRNGNQTGSAAIPDNLTGYNNRLCSILKLYLI